MKAVLCGVGLILGTVVTANPGWPGLINWGTVSAGTAGTSFPQQEDLAVPKELALKGLKDIAELYFPESKRESLALTTDPIAEVFVPIDAIANLEKTVKDLMPLFRLKTRDSLIYPITLEGKTQASVSLTRGGNGKAEWTVVLSKHPGQHLTDVLHMMRDLSTEKGRNGSKIYLVKIRGLNLEFIGYEQNVEKPVTLVATQARPEFKYKKGQELRVEELIPRIQEPARKYVEAVKKNQKN
jgi:hypothetical protein